MKFWYFNVQLLPVDGGDNYVGKEGYKKLFEDLNVYVEPYWEKMELDKIAYWSMRNYHAFKPFEVTEYFAYGKLTKFDLISKVYQPYTTAELFDAKGKPASSDPTDFYFLYSFEDHVLAIERKNKLPAVNVIIKMLLHLLKIPAERVHDKYVLHVSLLNDANLIEDFEKKAGFFYTVDVKASFSNSFDTFHEGANELQEEYREKGINKSHVRERAGRGGQMTSLSEHAQKLLALSLSCGSAVISYWNKDKGKRDKFVTDKHPVEEEVEEMDETGYVEVGLEELNRRIFSSIRLAKRKATIGEKNEKENRKLGEDLSVFEGGKS